MEHFVTIRMDDNFPWKCKTLFWIFTDDNVVQELRERVSKADGEKNRLEHKLQEMQNLLAKACELLKLEPPATYEEFFNGHAAVEGQEINNNSQGPVVGSMVNGFESVTSSSTLSQPEQDAVDSVSFVNEIFYKIV